MHSRTLAVFISQKGKLTGTKTGWNTHMHVHTDPLIHSSQEHTHLHTGKVKHETYLIFKPYKTVEASYINTDTS